jgi:putative nucleotidyltransferase with HDIG domain
VGWHRKPESEESDDRWQGRPVLAGLVTTLVFLVPITASIVVAIVVAHSLPRPHSIGWLAGWWVTILAVPTAVLFVTDRLARRALPLAVLLNMTLVFPDSAPRRLAVARKAGNTRDLARRVEEARTQGIEDEPVLAAEKILALAGTLNAHDRLTRGHGERVRALTDLIADELDLPATDRDRLRWSALLHDIGKIAVHTDILNKAGELNDEEWAVIKNHPLEGAKLTAPLAAWLGPWANTIAEHHEKFDGSGYPCGLSALDISYGGRIVAVADAYDTMTAVRSYKKGMSPQAARAELAACAGTQFDPQVVRAFLDVSIGRLRVVAGPITWLGSLPFVSSVPQLGQVAATAGRVAAASVAVAGAVTAGSLQAAAHSAAPRPTTHSVLAGGEAGQGAGSSASGGSHPSGSGTTTTASPTSTTRPAGRSGSTTSGSVPAPRPGSVPAPTPGSVPARAPGSVPASTTSTTSAPVPVTTQTTAPPPTPCDIVRSTPGAQMPGAQLVGCNLSGLTLSGVNLDKADLDGADLENVTINSSGLNDANLFGADLQGADLTNVGLGSADLENANLDGLRGTNVGFGGADLTGATMTGSSLSSADFNGGNLGGVDASNSTWSGVGLISVNLDGAVLNSVNLNGSQLNGSTMSGTSLSGTNFVDASLLDVTGTPINFASAVWGNTICPSGTVSNTSCF